jgi:hypothetical protein
METSSIHAPAAFSQENRPRYPLDRDRVVYTTRLGTVEREILLASYRESNLATPYIY